MIGLDELANEMWIFTENREPPLVFRLSSGRIKDIHAYTQDPSHRQFILSVSDAYEAAYALITGVQDDYTNLAKRQPLVKSGKISYYLMCDVLRVIGGYLRRNLIVAEELVKHTPQSGRSIFYSGWRVNGNGEIDLSNATGYSVPLLMRSGIMPKGWAKFLNVPADSLHHFDKKHGIRQKERLGAVAWDMAHHEKPTLYTDLDLFYVPNSIILLGSKLEIGNHVEEFEPVTEVFKLVGEDTVFTPLDTGLTKAA